MSIHQLPWLQQPADELKSRLRKGEEASGLAALQELSRFGWGEADLRRLGQRIRAADKTGFSALRPALAPFRLVVISARTVAHLTDSLIATALRHGLLLELLVCEYEAPEAWIARNREQIAAFAPNAALIFLDAEAWGLQAAFGDADAEGAAVISAVERANGLTDLLSAVCNMRVIVATVPRDMQVSQLSMDAWAVGSAGRLVARFNDELAKLAQAGRIGLFDVAGLSDLVGAANWFAGRYWFVAKYPFSAEFVPFFCERLCRLLASAAGRVHRVLALDLDNTLWGGIVGDDGVEGLKLGSGSPLGEAFLAIQEYALQCKQRGAVLCLVSKNSEAIALDAIRRHPEMLLKEDDFAAHKIDWNDKANNLRSLALTLNVGLDSIVFLDDNPAERKRVRDDAPEVVVPEVPKDVTAWISILQGAGYFEQIAFSREDAQRTEFYRQNAKRDALKASAGDDERFLASLDMRLQIAPFDAMGRGRIAQLISKSNQFNLTTRRYGEADVARLEGDADWLTVQARLKDTLGDNGMISVLACKKGRDEWLIDLWLMSCRVLGRRVEEALLTHVVEAARQAGAKRLRGLYLPTSKNDLVRDHYRKLGFKADGETEGGFAWVLDLDVYVAPQIPMKISYSPAQNQTSAGHRAMETAE